MQEIYNKKLIEMIENISFDGIVFTTKEIKNGERIWDISILSFTDITADFIENETGVKYNIIILDQKTGFPDYFEAFLLDAREYVKGLIESNHEGVVVKKNVLSDKFINKITEYFKNA